MNKIEVLKKRRDFLRVARGIKKATSTLILQAAQSLCEEETSPKVGYTTTKKIGKANVRNRVRRRLRVVVSEIFPKYACNNVEYVIVGRYNTATCPYKMLQNDLKYALKSVARELKNGQSA